MKVGDRVVIATKGGLLQGNVVGLDIPGQVDVVWDNDSTPTTEDRQDLVVIQSRTQSSDQEFMRQCFLHRLEQDRGKILSEHDIRRYWTDARRCLSHEPKGLTYEQEI